MTIPRITDDTVRKLRDLHSLFAKAPADEQLCCVDEAVKLLGPLAPWWVQPEPLGMLADQRPYAVYREYAQTATSPGPMPGMTLVTCRWAADGGLPPTDGPSLLRPAAVLPVRWVRGEEHDPNLPRELVRIARAVIAELREAGQWAESESYGLRWALSRSASVDASMLSLSPDSAFLSLSSALALTRYSDRTEPNLRVWVTAAWDAENKELRAVDGVREKIATMYGFGADAIFVPPQNYNEARAACRQVGIKENLLSALPLQSRLSAVLKPILARLRVPPGDDASFEDLCEYNRYLQRFDQRARREFYRDRILDHVIERCKRALPEQLRQLAASGPVLVSVLSHNYELIRLAYEVFSCRGVYLIDTLIGDVRLRSEALSYLDNCNVMVLRHRRFQPAGPKQACEHVQQVYDDVFSISGGTPVVVDLTPGQKLTTLAFITCRRAGISLVYLCHDWQDVDGVGAPEPGTERYEIVETDQGRGGAAASVPAEGIS